MYSVIQPITTPCFSPCLLPPQTHTHTHARTHARAPLCVMAPVVTPAGDTAAARSGQLHLFLPNQTRPEDHQVPTAPEGTSPPHGVTPSHTTDRVQGVPALPKEGTASTSRPRLHLQQSFRDEPTLALRAPRMHDLSVEFGVLICCGDRGE